MTNKPDRIRERAIDDSWGIPKPQKPLSSKDEANGEVQVSGRNHAGKQ
jgi:hypothetical protein